MNRGQRRARWLAQHRQATQTASEAPGYVVKGRGASAAGRLHIEELVLHGFPVAYGHAIGEAAQQELTRVLAARGMPAQMMQDTTRAGARSFQLPPDAKPKAIGALVANAVYGGRKR